MQNPETHVVHDPWPIRLDQFGADSAAVTPYDCRVIAHGARRIVASRTTRSSMRLNPAIRLFIDFGDDGGAAALSEQLRAKAKDPSNISVTGSATNHYYVPICNWVKHPSAAKSILQKR